MMRISIITINFNNLQGLKETVTSVIEQTYGNKEMIVIDGGSTDGSAEYINVNKDKFSYSVSEKDNGIYNAMNKGVLHASADYVIFMNSGDVFFNKDVISDVFNNVDNNYDIIYGSTLCRTSNNLAWLRRPHNLSVMKTNRISAICHQSAFIRAKLMKAVGYDERYRILADYDFFYKCYQNGCSFHEVNKIVSVYDITGVSASPKSRHLSYIEQCLIHGIQPSELEYIKRQFIGKVKQIIRNVLPLSIKQKYQRLPNSYQEQHPLSYFKQME